MAKKEAKKKEFSFGSAHFCNEPSKPLKDNKIKSVNVTLSFEEALKLQLALHDAVSWINGLDRSRAAGKNAAVNVCIYPESQYITVNRAKLPKKPAAK